MKGVKGALGNMPGGQSALNRELVG